MVSLPENPLGRAQNVSALQTRVGTLTTIQEVEDFVASDECEESDTTNLTLPASGSSPDGSASLKNTSGQFGAATQGGSTELPSTGSASSKVGSDNLSASLPTMPLGHAQNDPALQTPVGENDTAPKLNFPEETNLLIVGGLDSVGKEFFSAFTAHGSIANSRFACFLLARKINQFLLYDKKSIAVQFATAWWADNAERFEILSGLSSDDERMAKIWCATLPFMYPVTIEMYTCAENGKLLLESRYQNPKNNDAAPSHRTLKLLRLQTNGAYYPLFPREIMEVCQDRWLTVIDTVEERFFVAPALEHVSNSFLTLGAILLLEVLFRTHFADDGVIPVADPETYTPERYFAPKKRVAGISTNFWLAKALLHTVSKERSMLRREGIKSTAIEQNFMNYWQISRVIELFFPLDKDQIHLVAGCGRGKMPLIFNILVNCDLTVLGIERSPEPVKEFSHMLWDIQNNSTPATLQFTKPKVCVTELDSSKILNLDGIDHVSRFVGGPSAAKESEEFFRFSKILVESNLRWFFCYGLNGANLATLDIDCSKWRVITLKNMLEENNRYQCFLFLNTKRLREMLEGKKTDRTLLKNTALKAAFAKAKQRPQGVGGSPSKVIQLVKGRGDRKPAQILNISKTKPTLAKLKNVEKPKGASSKSSQNRSKKKAQIEKRENPADVPKDLGTGTQYGVSSITPSPTGFPNVSEDSQLGSGHGTGYITPPLVSAMNPLRGAGDHEPQSDHKTSTPGSRCLAQEFLLGSGHGTGCTSPPLVSAMNPPRERGYLDSPSDRATSPSGSLRETGGRQARDYRHTGGKWTHTSSLKTDFSDQMSHVDSDAADFPQNPVLPVHPDTTPKTLSEADVKKVLIEVLDAQKKDMMLEAMKELKNSVATKEDLERGLEKSRTTSAEHALSDIKVASQKVLSQVESNKSTEKLFAKVIKYTLGKPRSHTRDEVYTEDRPSKRRRSKSRSRSHQRGKRSKRSRSPERRHGERYRSRSRSRSSHRRSESRSRSRQRRERSKRSRSPERRRSDRNRSRSRSRSSHQRDQDGTFKCKDQGREQRAQDQPYTTYSPAAHSSSWRGGPTRNMPNHSHTFANPIGNNYMPEQHGTCFGDVRRVINPVASNENVRRVINPVASNENVSSPKQGDGTTPPASQTKISDKRYSAGVSPVTGYILNDWSSADVAGFLSSRHLPSAVVAAFTSAQISGAMLSSLSDDYLKDFLKMDSNQIAAYRVAVQNAMSGQRQ